MSMPLPLSMQDRFHLPFSISFLDLPTPAGRAGKSTLMTRGLASSAIANAPAAERSD
jgi:hypothetical protein